MDAVLQRLHAEGNEAAAQSAAQETDTEAGQPSHRSRLVPHLSRTRSVAETTGRHLGSAGPDSHRRCRIAWLHHWLSLVPSLRTRIDCLGTLVALLRGGVALLHHWHSYIWLRLRLYVGLVLRLHHPWRHWLSVGRFRGY